MMRPCPEKFRLLSQSPVQLRPICPLVVPMPDSFVTRIIRREIPAVIAFMDAIQVNPGRVLVATQRQIETLMGLEGAKAAHLFVIATRVAKAAQTAFEPAGWQTPCLM